MQDGALRMVATQGSRSGAVVVLPPVWSHAATLAMEAADGGGSSDGRGSCQPVGAKLFAFPSGLTCDPSIHPANKRPSSSCRGQ